MFCDKCGAQVPDGIRFCGQCGNTIAQQPAPQPAPQPVPQPAPQPPVQQPVYQQPVQQPVYQQPVYQQPMTRDIDLYAASIGDDRRPFAKDTWEAAYAEWAQHAREWFPELFV